MKKGTIILLSILLLIPSFGEFIIFSAFKINQKEISKTICVQRKLVNNTCNGRCELQKSLKKFEENNKKMSAILKDKAEINYILPTTIVFTPLIKKENPKQEFIFKTQKTISVSVSNLKPPISFI